MIEYLLAQGYVKLRDNVNADTDDYIYELKEIENGARIKQTGLWSDKSQTSGNCPTYSRRHFKIPENPRESHCRKSYQWR